ncbi:hypothetical protein ACQP3J_32990, partial [Escherichia coli]
RKTTCKSWVSPSTLWIPGTELRMLVLAAGAFACLAISLAPDPSVLQPFTWEKNVVAESLKWFYFEKFLIDREMSKKVSLAF